MSSIAPPKSTDADGRLLCERERLNYCHQLFELEWKRKEQLEKKAQFYMTLIALVLGAMSLKGGLLDHVREAITSAAVGQSVKMLIFVELSVLGVAIITSLVIILKVMALRTYRRPRPPNLVTALYDPTVRADRDQNIVELLEEIATNYAIAVEANGESNGQKSVWLARAFLGALATLVAFAFLMATLIYTVNS